MVDADAPRFADAGAVVAAAYAEKKFDEFIIPAVVGDYRGMRDGDGILCFNFRADRVREILAAMLDPDFDGFARTRAVKIRLRRRHDAILGRARRRSCRRSFRRSR